MKLPEKEKAIVGIPEAAALLGESERVVRRGVYLGVIPSIRMGRLFKIPRWWIVEQRNGKAA